jgi:hypothetical protein
VNNFGGGMIWGVGLKMVRGREPRLAGESGAEASYFRSAQVLRGDDGHARWGA